MKKLLFLVALAAAFVGIRWWTERAEWHEEVDDEWRKVSTAENLYPR